MNYVVLTQTSPRHRFDSMSALDAHLERLANASRWPYRAGRDSSAEPAAWAAIALAAHGRTTEAVRPAEWLAELQQANGPVGVSAAECEPRWTTSLAMLAWRIVDRVARQQRFEQHIDSAVRWSLTDRGKTAANSPLVGHNCELAGWSWAAGTHSWLEPTCYFVLALSATGYRAHARTLEGLRLAQDRLLPAGGANYGNTTVLGQELLPHLQPTGLAMIALAGADDADGRIKRSLEYLERSIGTGVAPLSFSFACLGLSTHGRRPAQAEEWITDILQRRGDKGLGVLECALLSLAALPDVRWLPRDRSPHGVRQVTEASA